MAKRTLAERLEQVSQRKLRAEQHEARLRMMQRKEQSRTLNELGGLLVKAGIAHLPPAALLTCFRRIAEEARDPATVALWETEGSGILDRVDEARAVAVARFPGRLQAPVASQLRGMGFRWNRILNQWEGRVRFDEAKTAVAAAGGTVEKIGVPG